VTIDGRTAVRSCLEHVSDGMDIRTAANDADDQAAPHA
jgi:hypothetical protein